MNLKLRGSKQSRLPAPNFVLPRGVRERKREAVLPRATGLSGGTETFEAAPLPFVERTEWHLIARRLSLTFGQTFAQLGSGEIGLWLAQTTFSQTIIVERRSEAMPATARRAEEFTLAFPARFLIGEPEAIPLPDAALDGAVCMDPAWLTVGSAAALREIQRLLRPGGRLIIAAPVQEREAWETALRAAGFDVERLLAEETLACPEGIWGHREACRLSGYALFAGSRPV